LYDPLKKHLESNSPVLFPDYIADASASSSGSNDINFISSTFRNFLTGTKESPCSFNLPGTIPTEDAVPFPTRARPFLSNISPHFAYVTDTRTLSVFDNPG
jgi:hypothetical protein